MHYQIKQTFLPNLTTIIDKVHHLQNNKTIDKFIDDLIEGKETKLLSSELVSSLHFTIQPEYESRTLPPIDLHRFDGDASK